MARRTNRLSFDRLENRELMHGNVLASIVNVGHGPELFITEAVGESGQANTVNVSRLANGKVRVIGGNNSEGTFTRINGRAGQDFTLPTAADLVVDLGGGDDQLQVTNARFGNLFIGMDRVIGGGLDTVTLTGLKTTGKVNVETGEGQDRVFVRSSTIGNGPEDDLNINAGAGADLVEVGKVGGGFVRVKGNLIVNTFKSITEPEIDFVRINQTVGDRLIAVDTGAGNDNIQMGSVSGTDIVLVAGLDDDKALLTELSASSQIFVAMSEGNDTVDMTFLQANKLLSVDGGTGFDTLQHHLDAQNPQTQFIGWEMINGHLTLAGQLASLDNLSGNAITR